jgi:anthranilate synthase component 2
VAKPSVLVVDNFDSFTFTLVDYLRTIGADVTVMRNDAVAIDVATGPDFDALLVSPGPGRPEDAGISVPLAKACITIGKPLLGVCLGHQAIAAACGSPVGRVAPVHGKIMNVTHDSSGLFEGLPSPFKATRYHSLATGSVDPPLIANAWSGEGVIMGLRHEHAPVHGVQFHPESIGSEHGHRLLGRFLDLATATFNA